MYIEIGLAIIAFIVLMQTIVLLRLSAKTRASIHQFEADINRVSKEVTHLSSTLDQFIKSDLHKIATEAGELIGKLTDLTSDINNKSRSLNCLFQPFSFLSSVMSSDSSSADDLSPKSETIPQILKWIATSAFLIKTTREVVKKR